MLWFGYGLGLRLGLRKSARLYISHCDISGPKDHPDYLGARTVVDIFGFCLTVLSAIKLFAFEGLPWTHTWTGIFVVAYVIGIALQIFGRGLQLEEADNIMQQPWTENIFQIVDVLYIIAYSIQFAIWIGIFSQLKQLDLLAENKDRVNAITGTVAASLAVISYFVGYFRIPSRGRPILLGYWSLYNWRGRERHIIAVAAFLLFLIIGPPPLPAWFTSRYDLSLITYSHQSEVSKTFWDTVSTPLGGFSIVFAEVLLVSVFNAMCVPIARWIWPPADPPVVNPRDEWERDPPLQGRLNPLLRAARKWREVISVAFATTHLTFTALYFVYLYDSQGTIKSPLTEKLP